MDLTQIEDTLGKLKRNPVKTLVGILFLAALATAATWLSSALEESGSNWLTARRKLAIEQMVIGNGAEDSRLEVAIRNPKNADAVVKSIGILASRWDSTECCCPPPFSFTLEEVVKVLRVGEKYEIEAAVRSGSAAEYTYPARGVYRDDNCGDAELEMEMASALVLPKDSISYLHFSIPHKLTVVHQEPTLQGTFTQGRSSNTKPASEFTTDISKYNYIKISLSVTDSEEALTYEWPTTADDL